MNVVWWLCGLLRGAYVLDPGDSAVHNATVTTLDCGTKPEEVDGARSASGAIASHHRVRHYFTHRENTATRTCSRYAVQVSTPAGTRAGGWG